MISFYGDGPYFYNLPEILSFNENLSYYRPARYQPKWIEDDLLEELNMDVEIKNRTGLFCVKFEKGKVIIPLWKIEILNIKKTEKHYFFYIKFCHLINHIKNERLIDYSELFNHSEKLAEYFDSDIFNHLNLEQTDEIWTDIIEKIGNTTYPKLKSFKNTFFYRIIEIRKRKRKFTLSKDYELDLKPEKLSDLRYGYLLKPNTEYELLIFHKVPLDSDIERLRGYYKLNLSGPFKENVSVLNSEINSHYSNHRFLFRTINEKYIGDRMTFNCTDNMVYIDTNNPADYNEITFRRVEIPLLLEYSGLSIIINNVLPYIGFLIGSLLLTLAIQYKNLSFSLLGSILQTLSLIYLPKRK